MRRVIGIDIHRTFGEVVFWEDGELEMTPVTPRLAAKDPYGRRTDLPARYHDVQRPAGRDGKTASAAYLVRIAPGQKPTRLYPPRSS